jgi:hypothetical protein
MAHYAFLNEKNIVTEVIVGIDENDEIDWEIKYSQFRNQSCKRTSYNTVAGIHYEPNSTIPSKDQSKAFRKNFAGIEFFYDENLDAFIPPKPPGEWILDEFSCTWKPIKN